MVGWALYSFVAGAAAGRDLEMGGMVGVTFDLLLLLGLEAVLVWSTGRLAGEQEGLDAGWASGLLRRVVRGCGLREKSWGGPAKSCPDSPLKAAS